jgi:hypothetical protein
MMNNCLSEYYRCPEDYGQFVSKSPLSSESEYFCFGEQATCYGAYSGCQPVQFGIDMLHDGLHDVEVKNKTVHLPFDPSEVVDNLRCERYVEDWRNDKPLSALTEMYYFLRPILPVGIRRHLQKLYLRGWEKIPFPRWPVDTSVDSLLEQLLLLSIRSTGVEHIPLIWFWPDGAPSCAIMTHDVETRAGRDFCQALMAIDDSFGIKASFQVIPEERYRVDEEFLSSIRSRGFEVVVHDLNHDGHLYKTQKCFLERAVKINAYGRKYGAKGFRAGVLYRKQLWYDALEFDYDMSVPNVAHLDPQRGGCCTVMPYFLGNLLELPVTTSQDYTLFNILNDYSTNLWERQIKLIMEKHGLMSFVVHPDYIMATRERRVYEHLLSLLVRLREGKQVWIATPGEVNRWWRQRAEMKLIACGDEWLIEGEGNERARIAYAREERGKLVVTFRKEGCLTNQFGEVSQRS